MTEAEITTEIAIVQTAITNLLLTGQEYEVGTGSSRRKFVVADLKELRSYKTELNNQLREVQQTSGVQVGF